jgi:TolB-like protein
MSLRSGGHLGAYEILAKLGEGGMGEVYRARDTRLGREVALKLLPPEVTSEAGRLERFDREARAIAALNHPHIITIYSTEEAEGVRFLTMELVEGQTLTELIEAGGLSIARFLDIAMPLADALTAAHQKQITHRDLKPSNVMVTHDGRVKVLDFGLARVGSVTGNDHGLAATLAPVTQHGMIVGTIPYMSPEQIEGRRLDTRSDLFSLGVIFYELLTGRRPFQGSSSPAVMSAILRDTPSQVSDIRLDAPEPLTRLVARCLEKRPEDRVQTARDVYNELRHLQRQLDSGATRRVPQSGSAGAAGLSEPGQSALTITVLPFQAPPTGDAAWLAEGLGHSVVVGLSRFQYLRVITRTMADGAANGYTLQGTVREAGGVARVIMQLSDAETGASVWADTYDRDLRGATLFDIQDDLTATVVATIADTNGALVRSMAGTVRNKPVDALTPYEAVLRRFLYIGLLSPAEHALVREALEKSVERAPGYALAWGALAQVYVDEYAQGFNPRPAPLQRARAAVDKAIEADPASHAAQVALAMIAFFSHDRSLFRAAAERALTLNPFDSSAMSLLGTLKTYSGDREAGLALSARARALNPHHPGVYWMTDIVDHYSRRDYEGALAILNRVNMPAYPNSLMMRAAIYGQLGRLDEGRALVREAVSRAPGIDNRHDSPRLRWFERELAQHIQEGLDRLLGARE